MKLLVFLFMLVSSYSYGAGSCESQSGHWSKLATSHANELEEAVKNLASREECNYFSQGSKRLNLSNLRKLEALRNSEDKDSKEFGEVLDTPKNLDALRGFVGEDSGIMNQLGKLGLANTTIKAAGASAQAVQFAKQSVDEGLDYVGHFLDAMNDPANERCIRTAGFPIHGILTTSMKVVNSLASSSYTSRGKVNTVMSKFVEMLDKSHITDALQPQATLEFWNEISCLIESTTDNYCAIRDVQQMNLQVSKAHSNNLFKQSIDPDSEYNPLEAYFVLTRDIPNISKWVLEVLFGNEPMTVSEAERKNKVWETIVALLKDENTVVGTINEKILEIEKIYKNATGENGKKTKIIEVLEQVTDAISGAGWGDRDTLNFVKSNYPVDQIPFILIGTNKIPAPVTGIEDDHVKDQIWTDPVCGMKYNMNRKYDWVDFLENKGAYHCSLDNPDQVMKNIVINYRKIMSLAKVQALDYLNDFLVVDKIDLVSTLYKGVGISVYDSFLNMYNYLLKVQNKYTNFAIALRDKRDETLEALKQPNLTPEQRKELRDQASDLKQKVQEFANMKGNVDNLIPKLDRFFKALEEEAELSLKLSMAETEEERKELEQDYEQAKSDLSSNVIRVAFKELNVLFQQSNFLKRRIETFVLYDMRVLVREDILDEYIESWMVVSGNSLMDYMSLATNSGFESSYATVELDIQNALAIANQNLSMLETFSKDYFIGAINTLNAIEEGTYGTWKHAWKNFNDMFVKEMTITRQAQEISDKAIRGEMSKEEFDKAYKKWKHDYWGTLIGTVSINPKTMWDQAKSYYNMYKHRRRYPIAWKWDEDAVLLENYGNDGSLKQLRDKYCIQTLFYRNNSTYIKGICEGAEITNQYVENIYEGNDAVERMLKLSFDEISKIGGKNYAKRVCSFRDYKRNNEALLLLDKIKRTSPSEK